MDYPLLDWLRDSWAGQLTRHVFWLAPMLEILHFLAMSLLVGAVGAVDLAVLGLIRVAPADRLERLLPWALAGFGISLLSGLCLFAAAPYAFAFNIAFRWKIVCLLLTGLNAFAFRCCVRSGNAAARQDVGLAGYRPAKVLSGVSIVLWLTVIACARLIPYAPNE